ncbi:hypothetical protein JTE90_023012 [Oedothorax gibbosus]|uniref:Reverse transcriptase domain-containing protein n=1 Tax=Oedothorax gibbosus TaxID=931172 RepID=A0AAV6UBC3_9ARAC|nr:hypothetical protein JTE90_023012 [Oedothorax gibbosus]
MEVRNCERPLPSWFSWEFTSFHTEFLKTRVFQVRVGPTLSRDFNQLEGVPQGSVLSVVLFILKINDIVRQLPPTVYGTLFVDDFQISCASTNMSTVERQLQIAIRGPGTLALIYLCYPDNSLWRQSKGSTALLAE